jgi:hypothetical protein
MNAGIESPGLWGRLRLQLMGLGPRDLAGPLSLFEGSPVQPRLVAIVESFVHGYHLGLAAPDVDTLIRALELHDPERRGFAYEGAGMGVGLRVLVTPGSTLLAVYLKAADHHHYIVQIGAGWAMARVPLRWSALVAQLDPTYHWLAWDGYGFHEALFHPVETVDQHGRLPRRDGFALQAFDQGVGRALWFVRTADPDRVGSAIARFPEARRADLWGGVGLAAAYAGGVERSVLARLVELADEHRAAMGVGSLLALRTRSRAHNPSPHTASAVEALCGVDPVAALDQVETRERELGAGDASYPELRASLQRWLVDR